jgi:Flp pilus assembly protein TadG
VNLFRRHKNGNSERGQTLPLFAVFLVVMILFVGMAIDLGYAYVTKANISKAVDAAALSGMNNLSQGQSTAEAIAKSAFTANYGSTGRDVSTPGATVTFTADASGNTLINVSASTTINTFFARIIPSLQTLQVGATAQATRAKLIMSLVLDRSGPWVATVDRQRC